MKQSEKPTRLEDVELLPDAEPGHEAAARAARRLHGEKRVVGCMAAPPEVARH
jgi:hypothetical protein